MSKNFTVQRLTDDEFREAVKGCKSTKEITAKLGIKSTMGINTRLKTLPFEDVKDLRGSAGRARCRLMLPDDLGELIANSISWREVIRELGYGPQSGTSYKTVRKYCDECEIDYSHIPSGANWYLQEQPKRKAKKILTLLEKLTKNSNINSTDLRRQLVEAGIFQDKCVHCGIDDPKVLTLDHINGDHLDNLLENLRILCANCHMKTPTFGSRNTAYLTEEEKREREARKNIVHHCLDCDKIVSKDNGLCLHCSARRNRKVERPTLIQLLEDLRGSTYIAVADKYGVSDKCISKWIATHTKTPIPLTNKIPVTITLKNKDASQEQHPKIATQVSASDIPLSVMAKPEVNPPKLQSNSVVIQEIDRLQNRVEILEAIIRKHLPNVAIE